MEQLENLQFNFEIFKDIAGLFIEQDATDIHIVTGAAPILRIRKQLRPIEIPVTDDETGEEGMAGVEIFSASDTEEFVKDLIVFAFGSCQPFEKMKESSAELDFSFSLEGVSRFRAHIEKQRNSYSCSIHILPQGIPEIPDFPKEVKSFTRYHNGLVIVSGKPNTGKTTTIAKMVQEINIGEGGRKIVTLEDPIEYLHKHDLSLVIQREVGVDTDSFASGIKSAMHEDADVIVVGEISDAKTMELALQAADAGALVIVAMRSPDVQSALEHAVSIFPEEKQNQVREQLASTLKGVVCQQLIPCADEKYGLSHVAAYEIMSMNNAISKAVRKGDFADIPALIDANRKASMRTMSTSLGKLKELGLITQQDWFIRDSLLHSQD